MSLGFFSKAETQTSGGLPGRRGCGACGLWRECKNPKLAASGEGQKRILIVGEASSKAEDERGLTSVLPNLRKHLRDMGINVERDCRKINAVACRTPDNRDPSDSEIEACRQRVLDEIKENPPKLILVLGNAAIKSIIGNYWRNDLHGVERWRGWTIPDRNYRAWICPTFHPAYVERMSGGDRPDNPVVDLIFRQDLERAIGCLDKKLPRYRDEASQIEILDYAGAKAELVKVMELKNPFLFSHDYETTGLKPHAAGHRVVSASFCTTDNRAFAFQVPEQDDKALFQLWRGIMANPAIPKAAHHAKFEDNWTNVFFKTEVNGWAWDSMLTAHILDNRPKIAGLKFQYYVHFGLVGYEDEIYAYMQSDEDEEGGNGFNRMADLIRTNPNEVLIYNGIDSLAEHRLSMLQMETLKHPLYYNINIPF